MADPIGTHLYTCPLCEATCGLEIELDGRRVSKVRGDPDDVFSHGFICPKGASIGELHGDPDRISVPLIRREGSLVEASWDQAFEEIERLLAPVLAAGDRNALAIYLGNPNAHTLDGLVHLRALAKGLGSRNVYSASSVDQLPKQLSAAAMFGSGLSVPVPDLDRTDHLLMLGANPLVSNGSLMTAPDVRGRLRRLRERGGRIVVVDPRRTRTADHADEHHFIRPGHDAHLLAAIALTLIEEELAAPGELAPHLDGLDRLGEALAPFPPEAVAGACGIPAAEIRRMARELAAAERAVVYARLGTTTQSFGTLSSWLVDVLNVLTGNLDRPGGAMFTLAAAGQGNSSGAPGRGRGFVHGRWRSRVRELPETFGELPVAALAEEIDTPGEGRVRALITVAGNPLLSTPNSGRLGAAVESLELLVSLDCYLNETSSRADVVLPVPSPLERPHYDLALYQLAIRNVANYSPAPLEPPAGVAAEWRTMLRLLGVVTGQGTAVDVDAVDEVVALELVRRESTLEGSPIEAADPAEILIALGERRGPERILDLMLRCGPYGAGFAGRPGRGAGREDGGLSLELLERNPHGIDLGALTPRLPELLRTATGKLELVPDPIAGDLPRLERSLAGEPPEMVLIGRRHLRSNNSWMHNLPHLVRGPDRCTMQISAVDAERLGLVDGGSAAVSSEAGSIVVPVEITETIMPGVVSIPHGWGHDADGARLGAAAASPGVNSNLLTDEDQLDRPSGNAVLNGIPVAVARAPAPAGAEPLRASA